MTDSVWKLNGRRAELAAADWRGLLDLDHLSLGLQQPHTPAWSPPSLKLLALAGPISSQATTIAKAYIRGSDLVVQCEVSPTIQLSWEFCWRVHSRPTSSCLSLDLQISAQTTLLDSLPQIELVTAFNCGASELFAGKQGESRLIWSRTDSTNSAVESPPGAVLCRMPQSMSMLQMVHTSDFCGMLFDKSGKDCRVRWRLFHEHLEKGVIRRARLRTIFMPQTDDMRRAEQALAQFASEDPDLSA